MSHYKSVPSDGHVKKLEIGCARDLTREQLKTLLQDKQPNKYFGKKRKRKDKIEMSEMLIINRE